VSSRRHAHTDSSGLARSAGDQSLRPDAGPDDRADGRSVADAGADGTANGDTGSNRGPDLAPNELAPCDAGTAGGFRNGDQALVGVPAAHVARW
jgi:hypothetical protein